MTTRAMRPFEGTMPLAEARAIIDAAIAPIDRVERIRVQDANGRVLAHDVDADADVPPFSRAAMDGYAVRAADTAGASRESAVTLRLVGQTFTGQVSARAVGPGECIEVATGAPLPDGADAVVIVEDTDAGIRQHGSPLRIGAAAARTSAARAPTSAAARRSFAPAHSSTPPARARSPRLA